MYNQAHVFSDYLAIIFIFAFLELWLIQHQLLPAFSL